jgi:4-aminobutyrate aminotransferase / (S)-3-amino-2-methylpropionate transaminase / 5-aminovalerate transaminase
MDQVVENEDIHRLRKQFVPHGNSSLQPRYGDSVGGAVICDVEGQEDIDFDGGIGVMNIGRCHPRVVAAIPDQAARFTHTCFMVFPYEPVARLAEWLYRATRGPFPRCPCS